MDSFELIPEIEAEINCFSLGCVVDDKTFVNHFRSDSKPSIYYSKTLFSNYRQRLLIQFKTDSTDPKMASNSEEWIEQRFEFSIFYSKIKSIVVNDNQLIIKLTFPPLLYTIVDEIYYCSEDYGFDSGYEESTIDCDQFENCIEIKDNQYITESDRSHEFRGLRKRTTNWLDESEDNFTKINSIRIVFKDKTCLADIIQNLKVFEPNIKFEDKFFKTIECKPFPMKCLSGSDLSFDVKYSLEALTNHSFQLTDSLHYFDHTFEQFVDSVTILANIDEKCVESSLNDLRVKIENNIDINSLEDLIQSFNRYRNQTSVKWRNDSILMIRRCILTPTRLLLLPALPLQESRFLRIANPEYVIRVLIKDEDFSLLSFTTCKTSIPEDHPINGQINEFLYNKIVDRISNGITIAGRTYELVGASTSQLRDHGLVLYACDELNRNASIIREEIGEIDCLRNAAKFIARIGQSMSQSMGFIPNVDCVQMIDDIKGGVNPQTDKPFTFSDGVGMISQTMANELCTAFRLRNPSAFQIRYAGFKGILVVNPLLKGRVILMRPSMKKFESNSQELDVLKVSEPRRCYLNRPLVTILNQMGVSNDNFLELLYIRHKQLANAFKCECNAINLMKSYSGTDLNFNHLLDSGIELLREPFFVDTIQSIISKVSLDLKNKARILIPFDSARVMYGVLDETRTLQYGQVFVQYTQKGRTYILKGEVLVTKYPCMHAGDVRKLEAIDVPSLHHIVDCIVFPANGERPHPDEMAGSDLDGDEYSVIWYKPLIFKPKNYPPMNFPSGEAEDLGRSVTNEDILKFYCRFIAHNQVGLIAHSHLVWADTKTFGIKCRLCEHLAFKYAVALDYAKTGINERLRNDHKPKLYPDFMMKLNEKPTYKSEKALGKLFQKNCYFHEVINEFTEEEIGFDLNPKLIHEKADNYMEDARHMFTIYDNYIKELMDKFGIDSEASLVSSSFNKTHKYLSTHNDNSDVYDLVTNIIRRLFADILRKFESGIKSPDELLAKASAWYQVSHEVKGRRSGFPWIVSKYLARLAQKKGYVRHNCRQIFKNSVESDLKVDKQKIVSIFHRIISNSLVKMIGVSPKISVRTYLSGFESKIQKVFKRFESEDNKIPVNVLIQLFCELTKDINDFEKDYDIAIIGLMTLMKIRRMGVIKALIYECKTSEDENKCVLVVAITPKLTDILRNYPNFDDPKASLIPKIKALTGVSQLVIKYGPEDNESNICVFGSRRSVNCFKGLITEKYIDSRLKNEDFDLTFK